MRRFRRSVGLLAGTEARLEAARRELAGLDPATKQPAPEALRAGGPGRQTLEAWMDRETLDALAAEAPRRGLDQAAIITSALLIHLARLRADRTE